ncbi:MAG TPA: hypothetical protein VGK73_26930 [Polyangiaceae bacterium]
MSGGGTGGALGGAGSGGGGAGGSGGSAGGGAEDYDMQPEDFGCISELQRVRGYRIKNMLGHDTEAVAAAENDEGAVFPVGTVIQHLPNEAMVKRRAGFSAETKDWEFFVLTLSAQGTTIAQRGTTDVETSMGATCVSCHTDVPDQYDFICNTWGDSGDGTCGFNLSDMQLMQQEASDPRCD